MIDDFMQLFEATSTDFTAIYAHVRVCSEFVAGAVLAVERQFTVT